MPPGLSEAKRRPVPWRYGDLLAVVATGLGGLAVVGIAAFGSSGSTSLATQVRWTNVGVVGVLVLGVGNLLWLITGRRAVGELRRAVLPMLETIAATSVVSEDHGPSSYVSSRVMTRYHLATCALVRGKAVRSASLAVHQQRGRRPCGVCVPAEAAPSD